jgi:hypothetical protein
VRSTKVRGPLACARFWWSGLGIVHAFDDSLHGVEIVGELLTSAPRRWLRIQHRHPMRLHQLRVGALETLLGQTLFSISGSTCSSGGRPPSPQLNR